LWIALDCKLRLSVKWRRGCAEAHSGFLTRDATLSSGLAPQTPAYDVQQACATSLETAILVGNKIAVGQIEVGIAGGVDSASDAPIAISERLRRIVLELNRTKSTTARLRVMSRLRPSMLIPAICLAPTPNMRARVAANG